MKLVVVLVLAALPLYCYAGTQRNSLLQEEQRTYEREGPGNWVTQYTTSSLILSGSGCQLLEDVLAKGADPQTSVEEYVDFMSEFLDNDKEREVAAGLKQCFLRQSNETLANFMVLENAIFDSLLCAPF